MVFSCFFQTAFVLLRIQKNNRKLTANFKVMKTNSFLKATSKGDAFTLNGAVSNSSTGDLLVDQFGKAGTFRGRDLMSVFADESAIWGEDPLMALRFPFYLRMVTRKSKFMDGKETDKVQNGQGARDESYKRLLWIAKYHPDSFYKNLWLLPVVGSWKDLWILMTMDDSLDKEKFFEVIAAGIKDDYHRDLVKKYLPRIRSFKKCHTDWATKSNRLAQDFCKYVGWTPSMYATFKSTGKAHDFQQKMCAGLYDKINFSTVPGRALALMNKKQGKLGTFIERHGLSKKYTEWLKKQPVVKFTGYPYELLRLVEDAGSGISLAQKFTFDKQFDGLLETAKQNQGGIKGNVWCALDTSGSMMDRVAGKISAYDICVSLGIYFSSLNEGAFKNHVIMFDATSHVMKLSGTFTDKVQQIAKSSTAWGSTNFQSVIDEIVRIRRSNPNIPLEDYPDTLLVVSDMQFNPTGNVKTNYEVAMNKLRLVFPATFIENFKVIWWQVNGRANHDYPSTIDDGGTYVFSGFDGSVVTMLLGGEVKIDKKTGKKIQPTMREVVDNALSQEVLSQVIL